METNDTITQTWYLVNKTKEKHDALKAEIFVHLDEISEIEGIINEKLKELDIVESEYVDLMLKMKENDKPH